MAPYTIADIRAALATGKAACRQGPPNKGKACLWTYIHCAEKALKRYLVSITLHHCWPISSSSGEEENEGNCPGARVLHPPTLLADNRFYLYRRTVARKPSWGRNSRRSRCGKRWGTKACSSSFLSTPRPRSQPRRTWWRYPISGAPLNTIWSCGTRSVKPWWESIASPYVLAPWVSSFQEKEPDCELTCFAHLLQHTEVQNSQAFGYSLPPMVRPTLLLQPVSNNRVWFTDSRLRSSLPLSEPTKSAVVTTSLVRMPWMSVSSSKIITARWELKPSCSLIRETPSKSYVRKMAIPPPPSLPHLGGRKRMHWCRSSGNGRRSWVGGRRLWGWGSGRVWRFYPRITMMMMVMMVMMVMMGGWVEASVLPRVDDWARRRYYDDLSSWSCGLEKVGPFGSGRV